jgi:hypothetical protein
VPASALGVHTTQLTNCSSATRRSVPGELPEQRVEVRAEGAAPPGPARTSRPSVADCRRSSIRHANLATPQRLRLSEACAPAARPSRDRLLGAEQKRAAAAAMVMQGICAAPRGIALRNTFINSIWETPSINNPLPRDYPPPQNTGHKSVALRVYRDPTTQRLRGARGRSVQAVTMDWAESTKGWGQIDVDQVCCCKLRRCVRRPWVPNSHRRPCAGSSHPSDADPNAGHRH